MLRFSFLCLSSAAIAVVGCKARQQTPSSMLQQAVVDTVWQDIEGELTAKVLFERLANKTGNLRSLDDLIAVLPNYLFSQDNAILLHSSDAECKHVVNEAYPRVILFDRESRLILSYVGSPEDSDCYRSLRVIQGDTENPALYTFYDFSFSEGGGLEADNFRPSECAAGCHDVDADRSLRNGSFSGGKWLEKRSGLRALGVKYFPIWNAIGNAVYHNKKLDWWAGAYSGLTGYVSTQEDANLLLNFGKQAKLLPRYRRIAGDYSNLQNNPKPVQQSNLPLSGKGFENFGFAPHANALFFFDQVVAPAYLMPPSLVGP